MERDEVLAEQASLRDELAKHPATPPDVDVWRDSEQQRIARLTTDELVKELAAAEKANFKEQQRVETLKLLRQQNANLRAHINQRINDNHKLVQGDLLPNCLANALSQLAATEKTAQGFQQAAMLEVSNIEWRLKDTQKREKSGWTMRPDSTAINAELAEARTKLIPLESRLTNIRAAATKVRALINVPGDVAASVRAVLDDLHNATMSADFAPAVEVATVAAPAGPQSVGDMLKSMGVWSDTGDGDED